MAYNKGDNFNNLYDGMTYNRELLEGIIGEIFDCFQKNPDTDTVVLRGIASRLCTVGENMAYTQSEFIRTYGDKSIAEALISNLEAQSEAFRKTKEDLTPAGKSR